MIAMLAEIRALNAALKVHAELLEKHAALMQQHGAGALAAMPAVPGVMENLGRIFSGFVGDLPPEEPPARRRRR